MLKAVMSSKIFKASNNKAGILSAMNMPNNVGLVAQLSSYLNEDSISDDEVTTFVNDDKPDRDDSENLEVSDETLTSDLYAEMPENFDPDVDTVDYPEEIAESEDSDDESSSEEAPSADVESCINVEYAVLKGSLNSREDCNGVSRVLKKDSEIWIYYEDDVNLNNIMSNVIEYLNASGSTYLEFNRLARSDNAMVFEIIDSQDVKPMTTNMNQ